jgi:hypothetical protein
MLVVHCEAHLANVRAHADSLGKEIREQLEGKLSYLEHYRDDECVCELMVDFAPYSFAFNMLGPVKADGSRDHWFNGGLILHNAGSTGVEFPVLSVTMSPQDKPHWSVHT